MARIWHNAWHAAHGHLVPQHTLALCTTQAFERRAALSLFEHDPVLQRPRPTALLANNGGSAHGFAIIRGGAEIEHIYVCPDSQGNGIGSGLLAAAEQIMLEERQSKLGHLVVAFRNQRAVRFYKRHAWITTDRQPWMSTAPWEPVRPPELPLPVGFRRDIDTRGGLTQEEFDATQMRCVSMKKFLGYVGNPNDGGIEGF